MSETTYWVSSICLCIIYAVYSAYLLSRITHWKSEARNYETRYNFLRSEYIECQNENTGLKMSIGHRPNSSRDVKEYGPSIATVLAHPPYIYHPNHPLIKLAQSKDLADECLAYADEEIAQLKQNVKFHMQRQSHTYMKLMEERIEVEKLTKKLERYSRKIKEQRLAIATQQSDILGMGEAYHKQLESKEAELNELRNEIESYADLNVSDNETIETLLREKNTLINDLYDVKEEIKRKDEAMTSLADKLIEAEETLKDLLGNPDFPKFRVGLIKDNTITPTDFYMQPQVEITPKLKEQIAIANKAIEILENSNIAKTKRKYTKRKNNG